jgi:hypothetical protein
MSPTSLSLGCTSAGLYQAGPRNLHFRWRALAGWVANAAFQALLMFAMVMLATQAIYADRASGTTFTHWEVRMRSTPASYSSIGPLCCAPDVACKPSLLSKPPAAPCQRDC